MCEKHPILHAYQGFIERCVKWISIGSLPTPFQAGPRHWTTTSQVITFRKRKHWVLPGEKIPEVLLNLTKILCKQGGHSGVDCIKTIGFMNVWPLQNVSESCNAETIWNGSMRDLPPHCSLCQMAKGAATPVTSLDHNNTKMMYGRTATVQQLIIIHFELDIGP